MIRIDSIWLATDPMDMRAGTETALARVIAVFGAAKPHCAYLFANRRATRMTGANSQAASSNIFVEIQHSRRKFFELHATNKSQLAEQALRLRNRERSPRSGAGFTVPNTAIKSRTGDGYAACLDDRPE